MPAPPLSMTVNTYGPTPCDFQQGMQVRFDITILGDPASVSEIAVSVYILDSSGHLFRRLDQAVGLDSQGVGHATLIWDGRDGGGRLTPPGRDYGPTFEVSGRLPDGSRASVLQQFCSGISSVGSRFGSRSSSWLDAISDLGSEAASNEKPEDTLNCLVTPWDPRCWNEVAGWWPPRPPVPQAPGLDQVDPGPGAGPPPVTGGGGVQPPVVVGPGVDPPPFGPRPRSPRPAVARPGNASGTGVPGSACPIR